MVGACSVDGEGRGVCSVPLGKLEGKRQLERPRRKRDDNILVYLQKVRCVSMDWIQLTKDRDRWCARLNAVMNLRVQ
jgi:hypothetical protein